MKPYSKLRGKMAEMDKNATAIAYFLRHSPQYVSSRMNLKGIWNIDEIYAIMEFLEIPKEQLTEYFPPNGGLPQKGKVCR